MPRSRDRHGRGIRGPLSRPNAWTTQPAPIGRRARADFFADCVTESVADIERYYPSALRGIRVAVSDVPHVTALTTSVPLAEAVDQSPTTPAHVVLYRRPLEHRSRTRADLRRLVHRILVEQVSLLTSISVADLAGDDFDDQD